MGYQIGAVGAWGTILIAGLVAVIAVVQGFLFAEMASMFPDKPGGIALYAHEAWKRYFAPIGSLAAFGYWMGYSLVLAITGIIVGSLVQAQWFPNVTWTVSTGAVDLTEDFCKGLIEAETLFANTSKHVLHGDLYGEAALDAFIDMAAVVVGGRDKLRERPIVSSGGCPSSPLQLGENLCDIIIGCARAGIPAMVLSMALAGATGPVTLAGTLVTHNAEVLSGLVLHQLTVPGAPFIYGSSTTMMDMTYATAPVGCPELGMVGAAAAALARYYLLPSFMAGG
jgi:trimethylamine:corrinoid methyltransferase-like protein